MLPTSSSESSIMLKLFKLINDLKISQYFHISIVGGYISNLSTTCHFPHLPSAQLLITRHPWHDYRPMVVSFKQELKKLFTVPRLNKFYQTQNQINKFHLLEAFLSLLLQLLYHKTPPTVGPWEEVRGRLASYIDGEDNSVMQILELSYKHLPDHLKPCFLYFGEFEEDEEISVGKLKRLWVAEGFIRKEKDKSAENIAGEYLMELINKSLVMIAKRRKVGRGAKSCVVHDLLRDLCLKKSKEESFLKYLNSEYHTIYENGHRVRAFNETATLSYCQHVRSFVGNYQSSRAFYVRDMRLLRVLHFKGIDLSGRMHTFGIEYLINLRYLVIRNLPSWIDKLVNLEYLRITSIGIIYLTPAIVKLKKLRYLHAEYYAEYVKDWNISNQTNNLEYLSWLVIRKLKDEEGLKCSPHLRKLGCTYYACPNFDLRFLTQLESLFLRGSLIKKDFGFPSNIRKLSLFQTFLPWEKMSVVGRLECLEVLNLFKNAFVGERWDTRGCEFQKLRFLKLSGLYSLREWNVASDEYFPKLQQLILIGCTNLQEIPSELGESTALELIEVESDS
ncbi:hypothetical protein ACS0TY_022372 [Phlomoides rotata]